MELVYTKAKELYHHRNNIQSVQDSAENFSLKSINEIAVGDILGQDVYAVDDLPPFRASVMDGYTISRIDNEHLTTI